MKGRYYIIVLVLMVLWIYLRPSVTSTVEKGIEIEAEQVQRDLLEKFYGTWQYDKDIHYQMEITSEYIHVYYIDSETISISDYEVEDLDIGNNQIIIKITKSDHTTPSQAVDGIEDIRYDIIYSQCSLSEDYNRLTYVNDYKEMDKVTSIWSRSMDLLEKRNEK